MSPAKCSPESPYTQNDPKPRETVSSSLALSPSLSSLVSIPRSLVSNKKYLALQTEWQRLVDVAKGTEMGFQGFVVKLRIRRLRRSFCGDHGGYAPPSLFYRS